MATYRLSHALCVASSPSTVLVQNDVANLRTCTHMRAESTPQPSVYATNVQLGILGFGPQVHVP